MRLARGRAGWALLTAGTVGLTVSGAVLISSTPVPAKTAEAAPSLPAAQARLAEIKVELAWLTDPTTFPYELAVGAIDGRLEVGGIVPNDALRQRTLLLARLQSPLPVVDKVVLVPKFVVPIQDRNSDLGRAAEQALTRAFSHWKGVFQVSADVRGQITVTGEVPSCEDKLTVSRRLAQLTGCTAVINELAVVRVVSHGKAYTVVSADGKVVLPGEPKEMMPSFVPSGTQAAAAAAAATPPKPTPPAVVVTPPPKPTPPLPPAVAQAPPTLPTPAAPATSNSSIVLTSAPLPPKPTPPAPLPPAVVWAPVPVPAPAAPPTTSNSILLASATTPAVPNAVRTPTPPAAPPAARVTPPPKPTKPAAAQLTPAVVAKIRHRLEQTCGTKASNLALKVQHSDELALSFTVHKESEGWQLGLQVMNLPELAPYKVDLKVDVK